MHGTRCGVGIAEGDGIAVGQRSDIDIESGLRPGRYRSPVDCPIRQSAGQPARNLIELILRLDQNLIAHFDIGSDLAGADRLIGEQIHAVPGRILQRDRAQRTLCWVGVPLCVRTHCCLRRETQMRRLGANQLDTGGRENANLIVAAGDDADVHQLRQLVDVLVALIQKRSRRGIARRTRSAASD